MFILLLLNFLIIQSSIMVIFSLNPIYSIFNLILVFLGTTIFLLYCGVNFIAMLFLIIYVGAIAILFLFVIMMLNLKITNLKNYYAYYIIIGSFISFLFLFEILIILFPISIFDIFYNTDNLINHVHNNFYFNLITLDNIQSISVILYTESVYLFILASFILFIAMIGVIILTLGQKKKMKQQDYYMQTNALNALKLYNKKST